MLSAASGRFACMAGVRYCKGNFPNSLERNNNVFHVKMKYEKGSFSPDIPHQEDSFLYILSHATSRKVAGSSPDEVNIFVFIWFVRLLALRPLLAYCASLR
jgi:hypothetical protein